MQPVGSETSNQEDAILTPEIPAVVAVDWVIAVDGDLREWGAGQHIALDPGGDHVGLRGVFGGWPEYEAVVSTYWDAENLYIAAAITDDVLDAGHVAPENHKIRGPKGEKDAMFYHDHLKIFVRGPEADTGFNIWFSPLSREASTHYWGGRQRSEPTTDLPLRAGVQFRESGNGYAVYSYEVALPWTWLGIHPYPHMVLDAMFLLVDSDRKGQTLSSKITVDAISSNASKWIWWRDKLELTGDPPGLDPPPPPHTEPESPLDRTVEKTAADLVSDRVKRGITRLQVRRDSLALLERENLLEPGLSTGTARELTRRGSVMTGVNRFPKASVATINPDHEVPSSSLRKLSERNRKLMARPTLFSVPQWVHGVDRETEIVEVNVDTIVAVVLRSISRLARQDIGGRTDVFVIDPARAVGIERTKVRLFLRNLAERTRQEINKPKSQLHAIINTTAFDTGIEPTTARRFISEILLAVRKIYQEEQKVTTTRELVKKARKKAKLKDDEAKTFLKALFTL